METTLTSLALTYYPLPGSKTQHRSEPTAQHRSEPRTQHRSEPRTQHRSEPTAQVRAHNTGQSPQHRSEPTTQVRPQNTAQVRAPPGLVSTQCVYSILYHYEKSLFFSKKYLTLVAMAIVIRPTALIVWLPLLASHFHREEGRLRLITHRCLPIG